MELRYLAEMEKHNLKISDLPEDAQTGIENINDALKGVKLNEAKGRTISPKAEKKIKAMDKWVLYEIYDVVNETDKNEEEIPYDDEDVLKDLKDEELEEELNTDPEEEEDNDEDSYESEDKAEFVRAETVAEDGDPKGLQIDLDLKVAFESGKKIITMVELKSVSKTAHSIIFDTYDDSGDNGIITTNFKILEIEEEVFELTKNN